MDLDTDIYDDREVIFMSKTLVAFFSATGTTKQAAKKLSAVIGADLYEIKPEVPYSAKDLNWMDKKSRSSMECNDDTCRPKLADQSASIEEYDCIFVGFPIWWYTAPKIIRTFLESYDFSGKTIILFATSGGSGLGNTAKELSSSCPGAVIKEGKLFNGSVSDEKVKQWAESVLL